jgi:hypothetical protein
MQLAREVAAQIRYHADSMTAKEALDAAIAVAPGERLRRFGSECGPRGTCRYEPCAPDVGRWSFCPDCLTVYDDNRKAVNPIPELRMAH